MYNFINRDIIRKTLLEKPPGRQVPSMLLNATALVDFGAMAITLWLGLYLLEKGFPSRIAIRAVVTLMALSVFFLSAFMGIYHPINGTQVLRPIMVTVGLGPWYSLTRLLAEPYLRRHLRWLEMGLLFLGAVTVLCLYLDRAEFELRGEKNLYNTDTNGFGVILYEIYLILIVIALLYNLLSGRRFGLSDQGRYFLIATTFPILSISVGIAGMNSVIPQPRIIQDLFAFGGGLMLGIAVARHQIIVERRISLSDFVITGLTTVGGAGLFSLLAWAFGLQPEVVALFLIIAILTHSGIDIMHEFLERMRFRRESNFRQKLRKLETVAAADQSLLQPLSLSLEMMCQAVNATGGFVAILREEQFSVIASLNSIPITSQIAPALVAAEDLKRTEGGQMPNVAWLAPAFEGHTQVAVIGLDKPKDRPDYSSNDLDLLEEVADKIGTLVSLSDSQNQRVEQIHQLVNENQAENNQLTSKVEEVVQVIASMADSKSIKTVEEGLRHLSDYVKLGQSALVVQLGAEGESEIEKGKALNHILINGIESLRPVGLRPREPLPRVWYNYSVLYDAYVIGVPNREIMSRLYISEGTFNRTRRNALRGLARHLFEKYKPLMQA